MKKIIGGALASVIVFGSVLSLTSCGERLTLQTGTYAESGLVQTVKVDYENAHLHLVFDGDAQKISAEFPYFLKGEEIFSEAKAVEKDGVLTITEKRVNQFGLNFNFKETPTLEIILPADRIYEIDLQTVNGGVTVSGDRAEFSAFEAETVNGKIVLDAEVHSTGGVELDKVNGGIFVGSFFGTILSAETVNGEITFQKEISVRALSAATTNGSVQASAGIRASEIELKTAIGSITAKVVGQKDSYSITAGTEVGNSNLQSTEGGKENSLTVETSVGEIQITFTE